VNYDLLLEGAEAPDGFWLRYAVARALARLKTFAIVLLLPVAALSGLYWAVETTERGKDLAYGGQAALATLATVAGAALLHVSVGALLDLVCETSRFGAVLQREYQAYFHTPVPYLVLVLLTLASGYLFCMSLFADGAISYRGAFFSTAWFLVFLVPILTIRTFAEEKASGTVEPLLTAPVTEAQVVAGKFTGAMLYYVVMLLPTLSYFVILRFIGREIGKPDAGPVVAGYVGMLLFGAFHIGIGIFASTLTQNTILGAFLAFVMILFFWIVGSIMETKTLVSSPLWAEAGQYLSPIDHLFPFLKGLLPPMDVIYFLSFILFFLFLSVRTIEYRKWR